MSLSEIDEECDKYNDYFNYLNNQSSKILVSKELYTAALKVSNSIKNDVVTPGSVGEEPIDGIVSIPKDIFRYKEKEVAPTFSLKYFPFKFNKFGSLASLILIKYTDKPISRFKEDFEEFKYGLEVAHAVKCITNGLEEKKQQIDIHIAVFDKYGRCEWFNVKQNTVNNYLKQYDKILNIVHNTHLLGSWDRPYYLDDDFRKL